MEGLEFLRFVWGLQLDSDAAYWLAVRDDDGVFHEFRADDTLANVQGWEEANSAQALYFCPHPFLGERRKENFIETCWLSQDLDAVAPDDCRPWFPDVWWETSPGRYQALWFLDNHLNGGEFDLINKALNRVVGADKGTWNRTRYLRVPGSWSGKRGVRVGRAHVNEKLHLVPA